MNPQWLNYDLIESKSHPVTIYFISGLFSKTIEEFFFHSKAVLKLAKQTKDQYVVSSAQFWSLQRLVCVEVVDSPNQISFKSSFMLIQLPLKCYSDIVACACACRNVKAIVCVSKIHIMIYHKLGTIDL